MTQKRKVNRRLSNHQKQLLDIVDLYIEKTGNTSPDLYEVAVFGFENGMINKPFVDVMRIVARSIARACRQDYVEDENGEPVRRRHAIKEQRGDRQLTLWPKMEDITPEKMRTSLQSRRIGSVRDNLQTERDRRYYNKHFNPGDPIEMDFNFNLDIEEHYLASDYPDSPLDDEESGDSPHLA